MKTKHIFRRGFTLIELMIVIVILGILMGTILPRLTGAQARARDLARQADLNTIAQALEVYFNDNGAYPSETGCLDETTAAGNAAVTAAALSNYLKGGTIIKPATETLSSVGCVGSYYYKPLSKNNIANTAYVLVSDMETFQMANYLLDDPGALNTPTSAADEYDEISAALAQPSDEADVATKTVFMVLP
jgi:type II secretion system protein G